MNVSVAGLITATALVLLCQRQRRTEEPEMTVEEIRDAHLTAQIERWTQGQ